MIRVGDFGSKVPRAVQAELQERQSDIAKGKLHPFYAKTAILNNQGREVIAKGQTLTDPQIVEMNWLVEGVLGTIGQ